VEAFDVLDILDWFESVDVTDESETFDRIEVVDEIEDFLTLVASSAVVDCVVLFLLRRLAFECLRWQTSSSVPEDTLSFASD
jgi:hypothetical protein